MRTLSKRLDAIAAAYQPSNPIRFMILPAGPEPSDGVRYTVDGKDVTEAEYQAALAEYPDVITIGPKAPKKGN